MPSDVTEPEGTGPRDDALAGSAGDDVDSHVLLSGAGGTKLRPDKPEVGLDPVQEKAAEIGWGRVRQDQAIPSEQDADNEGTGQSEKSEP
jgi:hypothetical protein